MTPILLALQRIANRDVHGADLAAIRREAQEAIDQAGKVPAGALTPETALEMAFETAEAHVHPAAGGHTHIAPCRLCRRVADALLSVDREAREDHHAADRGLPVRSAQETLDRINSDHPCCIGVGDAVRLLDELEQAQAKVAGLVEALKDLEWSAWSCGRSDAFLCCPSCGAPSAEEPEEATPDAHPGVHMPDCPLRLALDGVGDPPKAQPEAMERALITPEFLRQQATMTAGLDRDTVDALNAAAREIERLSHPAPKAQEGMGELLAAAVAGAAYSDALKRLQDAGVRGRLVDGTEDLERLFNDWHDKTHAALAKVGQ